jgi:TP901-1 family phage major tail protein
MAKAGKDMLIEYNTGTFGSPVWSTLGGFRSRRFGVNTEIFDVTTADSAGLEQRLLAGGVKSLDASGDGVFEDGAAHEAVRVAARAGTFLDLRITIPGLATYRYYAAVTDLEFGGDYNDALTYSATFMSSGQPTVALL